jgi:hypothetical protein
MAKALTDIGVRNLKPKAARREVPDTGQRGLYCIVQPSGAKSFRCATGTPARAAR